MKATALKAAAGAVLLAAALAAGQKADVKSPTTAPAKELTVEQIVDRTNRVSYYQGADGRANVKMTIVDARGQKRTRQMTILRWDKPAPKPAKPAEGAKDKPDDSYCGDQKFYVYFHRPADVNKMAFLVWKHLDKHDDRWLYLPGLDLVKRIAAGDRRTSFVGSHFLYEDVSGRNVNDDKHELVSTSANYYVLRNTPKKPKLVEFSSYKMWILRKNFLVVRTIYYNERNKPYRQYDALKWDMIGGYPTVTKARMTDLASNPDQKDLNKKAHTLLEYEGVKYDLKLPEPIFTERYLRRAPRKYLK